MKSRMSPARRSAPPVSATGGTSGGAQSRYGNSFLADQLKTTTATAGGEATSQTTAPQTTTPDTTADTGGHDHDHSHGHDTPAPDHDSEVTPEILATRPIGAEIAGSMVQGWLQGLQGSLRGKKLLEDIQKIQGNLTIPMRWSDRGSYVKDGNTVWLDRNEPESSLFGTLTHELVHYLTAISGNGADINKDTREDYLNKAVGDEIDAQAACFLALLQTGKKDDRQAGFVEFTIHLRRTAPQLYAGVQDPKKQAEVSPQIEAIAKTWIEQKYRTEWKTSNTDENYYDYYGKAWDNAHRARP